MSKMLFTFRWGKSIYVTDKDLKKILMQYYKKDEVDEILKRYATVEDVAAELSLKADLSYVDAADDHLNDLIMGVEETLTNDIQNLENHVNQNTTDIRNLEDRVTTNETNISNNNDAIITNKKLLDETVNELKKARLWNILGMYDPNYSYKIGDVVGWSEDDNLYLTIKEPNQNHLPSDKEYWIKISGIQQINLDDYYNKSQTDDFFNQLRDYINQQIKLVQDQINVIKNTDLPSKANKTDVDSLRSDVNNIKANYVTNNTTQTISGNKTFSGTTTTGTLTVDSTNGITVKSGSTRYKIYGSNDNLVLQNLDKSDFKKIMIANSTGEQRNLLDLNDYFSLENKINNLIKKKIIPFSQFGYVNGSEHSGYYNTTYNNNTGISGDIISIKLDTKNNSYSIQVGYSQADGWLDLYIAGNRGFENNIKNIIIYYI